MKKSIILVLAFIIFVSGIQVVNAYTVTFKRAEGDSYANYGISEPIVIKTCTTNSSNKLDSSCLAMIYKVCRVWNPNACYTQAGTTTSGYSINGFYPICDAQTPDTGISVADLGNITFTSNKTYYCHNGSSQAPSHSVGCYVCNSNHSIMKWDADGDADSKCSSGYTYDGSKTEAQCPPPATPSPTPTATPTPTPTVTPTSTPIPTEWCYICDSDSNIMKWATDGEADSKCRAGYTKDRTKNQSQCKPATPSPSPTPTKACYVCNADKNIMYWRTNGNGDTKCPGGYTKDTTKNQSQCQSVEPPKEACYVCKADKQVFKWKTTSDGDNDCRGGYNKTTLSKDNCLANPKTGSVKAIVALLIELAAFAVIFSYVSDTIFKKKKSK